mmetsp:Transcript_2931/g.3443  ORF Transcript_2931/g.3443 Transcript_2931/m.3443 type:complete len:93 (+) Transcript_2931:149-427(+)
MVTPKNITERVIKKVIETKSSIPTKEKEEEKTPAKNIKKNMHTEKIPYNLSSLESLVMGNLTKDNNGSEEAKAELILRKETEGSLMALFPER